MRSASSVLAFPYDANPYQELLYEPMRLGGVSVRYLGRRTRSRTLNLLLLPVELLAERLRGARTLHLHWTFGFAWPRVGRVWSRRASSLWFRLCLGVASLLGLRVVWTAHNVLPHAPVFADDVAEGRRLVRRADAVIVHSAAAAAELARVLREPRQVAVIPHGRFETGAARAGSDGLDGPVRALFFGHVAEYKGVEDLLAAFAEVLADTSLRLTIAGAPASDALRQRLVRAAAIAGDRVTLCLRHVPAAEVDALLADHDVLVLPFRRVTTSGSVLFGLGAGLPVAASDLPALDGLPVRRVAPGVAGVADALRELDAAGRATLREEGLAARAWVDTLPDWPEIAERTLQVLDAGAPR
jgi:glycosyltransferase involved in cell wall biosynthesis